MPNGNLAVAKAAQASGISLYAAGMALIVNETENAPLAGIITSCFGVAAALTGFYQEYSQRSEVPVGCKRLTAKALQVAGPLVIGVGAVVASVNALPLGLALVFGGVAGEGAGLYLEKRTHLPEEQRTGASCFNI